MAPEATPDARYPQRLWAKSAPERNVQLASLAGFVQTEAASRNCWSGLTPWGIGPKLGDLMVCTRAASRSHGGLYAFTYRYVDGSTPSVGGSPG